MVDQYKATLAKVAKLFTVLEELLEKLHAVTQEIDDLLGGRAGLGARMKEFEQAFDAAWCSRYACGQSNQYIWNYARDRPQMKRLLKALRLDDLKQRAVNYVRNNDPFYAKHRHPFGLFVASINSHANAAQDLVALDEEVRAVGCRHDPPCRSDQEHTRKRAQEMRV